MIKLEHDIAEIDVILKHLAKGSYEEVAFLIHKIQSQALPQHEANKAAPEVTQGQ